MTTFLIILAIAVVIVVIAVIVGKFIAYGTGSDEE